MDQFCLLKYEDAEVSIPLFDEKLRPKGPSVSVMIGANGSGKSRYLSRMVDELSYLNERRIGKTSSQIRPKGPSEGATIEYRIDGMHCSIKRDQNELKCAVNDSYADFHEMPFPRRVAAVAYLPSDRFRFSRNVGDSFYRYLGIRQATNLTTTGALETRVLESLIIGLSQRRFSEQLLRWLSLAGMSPDVSIAITLADEALITDDFEEFRKTAFELAVRRAGPGRRDQFQHDLRLPNDIDAFWSLMSQLRAFNWMSNDKYPSVTIDLGRAAGELADARTWIDGLEAARRWRFLRGSSLLLGKKNGRFPFSEMSSGEQQLIGMNVRILSELEHDALVVIDEPEISLHPAWQIKYVPTLLQCLAENPSTHIIIATHSHFVVSDLDSEQSALIVASNEDGPKFELFDGDVYGRSPENILYRVFGVATTGNSYVEGDLYDALTMISSRKKIDREKLIKIYTRLQRVSGRDNPAMNTILEKISYVINRSV